MVIKYFIFPYFINFALSAEFTVQQWIFNRNIEGHILQENRTLSKDACKEICETTRSCRAAVWHRSGQCLIKDTVTKVSIKPGLWAIVLPAHTHIERNIVQLLANIPMVNDPPSGRVYVFDGAAPTVQLLTPPTHSAGFEYVHYHFMHSTNGHASAAAVYWNGEVHVFGGHNFDSSYLSDLKRHNAYKVGGRWGTWREVQPKLPSARSGHFAVVLNNSVFVCGCGADPVTESGCSTCDVLQSNESTVWIRKQIPICAKHSAAAVANDFMFVSGSACADHLTDFHMFNATTDTWFRLPNLPRGRFGHGMAIMENLIYFCGGSNGYEYLSSCDTFDMRTSKWGYVADLNTSRFGMQLITIGKYLYAIAGAAEGYLKLPSIERYDVEYNDWHTNRMALANPSDTISVVLVPD